MFWPAYAIYGRARRAGLLPAVGEAPDEQAAAAPADEAAATPQAIGSQLDAGDYEIRLMRDDAYMTLAQSAKFSVSVPP